MPALILPRRFHQQPQGPVEIASEYSAFSHVYKFSEGLSRNWRSGKIDLTNSGFTLDTKPGQGGVGLTLSDAGSGNITVSGNPFATSTCTYLWVESLETIDSNGSVVAVSRYSSTAAGEVGALQVRLGSTGINILRAQQALVLSAEGARQNGRLNIGAVTVNGNNGRHAIFSGGRLAAESTPTSTYTHGTSGICNGASVDSINLFGPLYLLAFAPVALPDDYLEALTDNPWQIFRAPPRRVFYSLPSGGTSYTITPSGGTTLGGSQHLEYTKVIVPSGGLSLAGTSESVYGKIIEFSGGVSFGGSNTLTLSKTYTLTPNGGISFAGTSDSIYTKIIEVSGGITYSGSEHLEYSKVVVPDGGVSFGGTAPITTLNSYTITPDGGVSYSGSADLIYTKIIEVSGGINFGGSASLIVPSDENDSNQAAFVRRYIGRR